MRPTHAGPFYRRHVVLEVDCVGGDGLANSVLRCMECVSEHDLWN